jgi:hypothetical protein
LTLLNGPFVQEQSQALAARLVCDFGADRDRQIEQSYLWALGRPPREVEHRMARQFLTRQTELLYDRLRARQPVPLVAGVSNQTDPAAAAALADFCLALLNRNEFLYVD